MFYGLLVWKKDIIIIINTDINDGYCMLKSYGIWTHEPCPIFTSIKWRPSRSLFQVKSWLAGWSGWLTFSAEDLMPDVREQIVKDFGMELFSIITCVFK